MQELKVKVQSKFDAVQDKLGANDFNLRVFKGDEMQEKHYFWIDQAIDSFEHFEADEIWIFCKDKPIEKVHSREEQFIDPLMESKLYYDLSQKLVDIFHKDLVTNNKAENRPAIILYFYSMFETLEYLRDSDNYKIEANRFYSQLDKAGFNPDYVNEFRTMIEGD